MIAALSSDLFARHQDQLEEQGFVYQPHLPPDFDWRSHLRRLGEFVARDNPSGVSSVQAAPKHRKRSYSNSQNALNPHTEASFLPQPPRYLAIWGVRPASCGGGLTTVADGYELLQNFSVEERLELSRQVRRFPASQDAGWAQGGVNAPVVDHDEDGKILLRISYNLFQFGRYHPRLDEPPAEERTPLMADFCAELLEFFHSRAQGIRVERNSLLVMDNHRMLHARTAFDDPQRHLQNVWIA